MEDESKSNEEKPEKSSDDPKNEPIEEPQSESEVKSEEEAKEPTKVEEETSEEPEIEEKVEETSEEVTEEQPEKEPAEKEEMEGAEKPIKAEVKKEKPKKRADRGPDFKYIVRLSNTDVDGEKNVVYGLTSIKGVGVHMATLIADETGIDRYVKMGYLTDAQVEKLQEIINDVNKNAPGWMLNHRKDYDTGNDIH